MPVQRPKHVVNSASLLTHKSSSHAERATWIDSMSRIAIILLILTLGITITHAGDRKWPPIKGDKSCREATDGCQVCKFDPSGKLIGCSTPGIACQPGSWNCNVPHSGTATAASDKPKANIVGHWRAVSLQGWAVPEQRVVYLEFSKDGSKLIVAAGTPGQLGEVKLFSDRPLNCFTEAEIILGGIQNCFAEAEIIFAGVQRWFLSL